jgi:predicted RNase H-like nuclease (RuvC/YqgF family)
VDDQNLLNECSTTLYAQIFNKFAENEEKISELEKELYDCKKRCMALEDKLKETK